MRSFLTFSLLFLLLLQSCGADQSAAEKTDLPDLSPAEVALLQRGETLLQNNCNNCHPAKAQALQMGPLAEEVQARYREKYPDIADFIPAMHRFLQQPDPAYALMPKAIEQYGLMPKLEYSESDIAAVATYLYYADLDQENWLASHFPEQLDSLSKAAAPVNYAAQGRDYALNTKSVLGSQLLAALGEGGPMHAVPFCNERALPLTDSMSLAQNASIRRISDRPRNPKNQADSLGLVAIAAIRAEIEAGNSAAHQLYTAADSITAYYPILTNQMCLQCHGQKGQDIQAATYQTILERYPEDKAIGYAANELRGVWVVKWSNR